MLSKVHKFNKSQETEKKYAYIHDEVYELYTQSVNKKNNKKYKIKVDRETCNYYTNEGKEYQQADTDALLFLDCEETNTSFIKKISEKTRNRYYNDLYVEIVSILKWNSQNKKYEFDSIGWGLKNEELGPDCLSMLFTDDKKKTYNAVFISQYKKLKKQLFNEAFFNNMQNGRIETWLNKVIEENPHKGRKSFVKPMNGESKSNVKDIVFARNQNYITVGFTFSMKHIKSLVEVTEYKGKIVDQKTNTMSY